MINSLVTQNNWIDVDTQLNYEIWFELEQRDEFLEIPETVLLSKENDKFLISFFKPIMKQAFFNKLEMLSLVLAR